MSAQTVSIGDERDTGVRTGRQVEMALIAHRIVTVNTWVQPGESVLILYDHEVSPMIVEALAAQTYVVGGHPVVMRMEPQRVPGAEPPPPVSAAMKASNVIMAVISRSISHTRAQQEARAAGVRYLGLSNITEDSFLHGAATCDPLVMQDIGNRVRQRLLASQKEVRITSDLGMNATFRVTGRRVQVADSILPRDPIVPGWALPDNARMFPDGEVNCCPLEESVNGRFDIDHWMQGVGILAEPILWDFKDGLCENISGGAQAEMLKRILEEEGDEYSRYMGEFALGINPRARWDGNPHREGKKILGGLHFALGTGRALGGVYQSTLHLDGTIRPPRVYIDGELIFDKGKLMI